MHISSRLAAIVGTVCLIVALPSLTVAQSKLCTIVTESALRKMLKDVGGEIVDPILTVPDAVVAYFTHPDDTRLDAAMLTLVEGGAKITFPAYGFTIQGGRLTFGAVSIGIAQFYRVAREEQVEAFICGNPSFLNLFSKVDFFSTERLMQDRGINCNNFAEKVTDLQHLREIRSLWYGHYSQVVKDMFPGPENRRVAEEMLAVGWSKLEQAWQQRWAAIIFQRMRAALQREAAAIANQKSCEPVAEQQQPGPGPRPEQGQKCGTTQISCGPATGCCSWPTPPNLAKIIGPWNCGGASQPDCDARKGNFHPGRSPACCSAGPSAGKCAC